MIFRSHLIHFGFKTFILAQNGQNRPEMIQNEYSLATILTQNLALNAWSFDENDTKVNRMISV